jgi:chemotaxis protein MotB
MERWLLTYSDMITLLMALFIVMWSISAVNKSKFDELKQSLHQAFTHEKVLDGGRSVLESDGADRSSAQPIVPNDPVAQRVAKLDRAFADAAERADVENLRRVQRQIESYAREHGFSGQIRTSLDERGLVVRMLTDKVLFDTGKAVVEPEGMPLLHEIAGLLRGPKITNPVRVEGNTDTVPIHTAQFRSNWELSTARATAVLQVLLHGGVLPTRLSAAGYADQHPAASNGSAAGRKLNRRVEIVVLRHAFARQEGIE